jgi:hypothetical protein
MHVLALSPLLAKAWRMRKMMKDHSLRGNQVTNVQAFIYILPLVAAEFCLLLVVSFVDPPRQTELLGVGDSIEQSITCTNRTNTFLILQLIFHGMSCIDPKDDTN